MKRSEARANLRRVMASVVEYLDTRGGGPGRPTTEEAAVNQYQRDLEDAFDSWAYDMGDELAAPMSDEERNALLAALLLLLLGTLRDIGYAELPNAITIALGGEAGSPEVYAQLSEVMAENTSYLTNSLIPDIMTQLKNALADAAVRANIEAAQAAIAAGAPARAEAAFAAVREALRAAAGLMHGRVSLYAGEWWSLMNYSTASLAASLGKRIRWTRDPQAKHCQSCLDYGERTYESWDALLAETGGIAPADGTDCGGNCRCQIEMVD